MPPNNFLNISVTHENPGWHTGGKRVPGDPLVSGSVVVHNVLRKTPGGSARTFLDEIPLLSPVAPTRFFS